MFSELGFSNFDVLLPIACTIGAIFGSLAQTIIANYNLNSLPRKEGEMKSASPQLQEMHSAWLFLRLFVGGVLGFVVGLYFVGALQETPAVFAKIWALSFVVGYAAPKIWVVQERNLLNRIDSSLDQPEKASTGVPD
ncbi:hypothetical protein OD800_28675 [Pseudomonas aeruginosa]|uniref:hypothetical protein n=1 Tax=Pseudomonas aeruginosa TaxID=287 RepID=UPI000F534C40|nr:hypothetical protein [Pseudomonas aeruginosa]MBI8970605.1 hypothetical protein [Pseudomonas aeruginosa]MBU8394881.1 hypothetical protein [Pseudomonas aeruginosa]MCV4131210.1 hypothetical protein [Pseudomonas aeruginosa]MCV4159565.1 hypothetical protein [Pseudomonas aeruginosa]TEC40938.1 hypothetical protein IPC1590_29385 [Pseudomonas aeruginosa]